MFDLTYYEVVLVWLVVSAVVALVYIVLSTTHEFVCEKSKKPLEVYRTTLYMAVALTFGVACGTYIVKHKPVVISIPQLNIRNSTITSEAADRLLKGGTINEAVTQSRAN